MPPKSRITREAIVEAAVELVRKEGAQGLNARGIAAALGCSTQPVYSCFADMKDLRRAVKEAAYARYQRCLQADMAQGRYPPYKASGMAYIRFAREERELFKLLFMCQRSGEAPQDDRAALRPILSLIRQDLGLDEETAFFFHMEMWICAHGIAAMIATDYLDWDEDLAGRILTDMYTGMRHRYRKGEGHDRH